MALIERGRTGVTVTLAADGVTGVVTQDPEGMLHSIAGLTNADGNTAFGVPFSMLFYFTHTTTSAAQSTASAPMSTDAPFKFRVLGMKVRCITNWADRDFRPGYGYLKVSLDDNDGSGNFSSVMPHVDVADMNSGDVREVAVLHQGTSVIDENEGLRCKFESKADSGGTLPTVEFLVEVQCLRVK
jgi:hypothetical protein